MTVEQLLNECELVRLTEEKLAACKPFSCGEGDLDEFFAKDCLVNQRKLLGKTYLFCLKSQPDTIVTAFSLSNDSIRLTNRIADEYHVILGEVGGNGLNFSNGALFALLHTAFNGGLEITIVGVHGNDFLNVGTNPCGDFLRHGCGVRGLGIIKNQYLFQQK